MLAIFYINDSYSNALNKAVTTVLATEFPKIGFAMVHCATKENWKLCQDHGAEDYPTVRFFKDAHIKKGRDYHGDNDPEQIRQFIRKQMMKKKLKLEL